MEKRSSRKRSRKASEREEASEEPPAPLAKSRRRNSGGKSVEAVEKTRKGNARSKRKGPPSVVRHRGEQAERWRGRSSRQRRGWVYSYSCQQLGGRPSVCSSRTCPPGDQRRGVQETPDSGNKVQETRFQRKKRSWRSYKQVLAAERCLQWRPTDPTSSENGGIHHSLNVTSDPHTVSSLDAPPPLKPAKKYSDLSGLVGKYRDPLSGLLFHSSEEFRTIRSLPPDIVTGYLALRGKLPIM